MQNTTTINELNAFLKGEYMAIDSYEKYIRHSSSKNNKLLFQNIQSDHKDHALKISNRIQSLGGNPVTGVGFSGKVAEVVSSVKELGYNSDNDFIKEAYEGENKGIKIAEEIVKGDLDHESANLINNILTVDKNHLNLLKNSIKEN